MSAPVRVHVMGAACSGTTTLGRRLARHLGCRHLDTDAFYWSPAPVPFTRRRPPAERIAQLGAAQAGTGWVLSGSVIGWGDGLLAEVDLIVFLTADRATRLARLRRRERRLHGARIDAGGDMHHIHRAFVERAIGYDRPGIGRPSHAGHESWLSGQSAPILRLDGRWAVEDLIRDCDHALCRLRPELPRWRPLDAHDKGPAAGQ